MNMVEFIMYHYVRDLKNSQFPKIKGLDYQDFLDEIKFLKKEYNILSIEEFLNSDSDSKFYREYFVKLGKKNIYDYIEIITAESTNRIASYLGFLERKDTDLLPNNFEPFEKKNIDNIIRYKLLGNIDFSFFKGDSDRPLIL